MENLTTRQQEVWDYILKQHETAGIIPSLREIAGHFGFRSMTAARDHVQALCRKGYLKQVPGRARALQLTGPLRRLRAPVVDVPLYGDIPAGFAADREQEIEGCISVDVGTLGFQPTTRTFALQVQGDSMTGRHICDGDFVICEHGLTPKAGDAVAALIDNESTLKTFLQRRGKPYLRAENPQYPDLIPAAELVIQGVVVALIRKFE